VAIQLVIHLVCGVITAIIAAHKGRNAVGWFIFGFFFNLIAIIVVCVVSNLKEERARYAQAAADRRRLREELKMERMHRQQALGMANERLDIHDRALGVETSKAGPPPSLSGGVHSRLGPPAANQPPPPGRPPTPGDASPQWHYSPKEGEQVGPVRFAELATEYREGRLVDDTLVWRQGWKEWHKIGEVDGLLDALRA
jgi:hypothetical protein